MWGGGEGVEPGLGLPSPQVDRDKSVGEVQIMSV